VCPARRGREKEKNGSEKRMRDERMRKKERKS